MFRQSITIGSVAMLVAGSISSNPSIIGAAGLLCLALACGLFVNAACAVRAQRQPHRIAFEFRKLVGVGMVLLALGGTSLLADSGGVPRAAAVEPVALGGVATIAANEDHSMVLLRDGTVLAWGAGDYGQLGDGDFQDRALPVAVTGLATVRAIAPSAYYSLALLQDGTVRAWGNNNEGGLGDGTTTRSATPVAVSGLTGITAVAAGAFHSLALRGDGTVWAWGFNDNGQLGDNTLTQRLTPVQVRGPGGSGFLTNVVAIAGGDRHSLALQADGTVWAWGRNSFGQLGDLSSTQRRTPVQAFNLSGAVGIAAGDNHSLAVLGNGTVRAWGGNYAGQLGNGTITTGSTIAQPVPGLGGVTAVAATPIAGGDFHSLALKADGTVWAWGRNTDGQLGDGTTTQRLSPVQVAGVTGAAAVAAAGRHSLALLGDGTVAAWGANNRGQLGRCAPASGPTPQAALVSTCGTPLITHSTTSLDFGDQTIGQPSLAAGLAITNIGNVAIDLTGFNFAGANASDFSLSANGCSASLAPGGGCAIAVTFTPGAMVDRNAELVIAAGAAAAPRIALRGTGVLYRTQFSNLLPLNGGTCGAMGGVGIAFDGRYLWFSCRDQNPDLFKADPLTGQISAAYSVGGGLGALAWDGSQQKLWASWGGGPGNPGDLRLFDPNTGTAVVALTVPIAVGRGLTYDAGNNTLYVGDDFANIYQYNASNGSLLRTFPWQGLGPDNCRLGGLVSGGYGVLYEGTTEGTAACNTIYGVIKQNIDVPGQRQVEATRFSGAAGAVNGDMECDTVTFSPKTAIWVRRANRNALAPLVAPSTKPQAIAIEVPGGYCAAGGGVDTDGDGLLDEWERNGLWNDPDGDGPLPAKFIDLPHMGADPLHVDIFVQLDWMPDQVDAGGAARFFRFTPQMIRIVVDAFANAPYANFDGRSGINLHVDHGPDSIMRFDTGELWGQYSKARVIPYKRPFGARVGDSYSWDDFDVVKRHIPDSAPQEQYGFIASGRAAVFHYALSVDISSGDGGWSRGVPASDFLISQGGWRANQNDALGIYAGTFMHELGHNLGLQHGGGDGVPNKPNYLSVMSYVWTWIGLIRRDPDGTFSRGYFDYSRQKLPDLVENQLNENAGLGPEAGGYGTRFYCAAQAEPLQELRADASGRINWNCNRDDDGNPIYENPATADINNEGGNAQTLRGFNDWANLRLRGGALGLAGALAPMPTTTVADEASIDEMLNYVGPENVADFWDVRIGGPYSVRSGGTVAVAATAYDPLRGNLAFAWDLDGDGVFETAGPSVTFSAQGIAGPATRTITVRVTKGNLKAVARTTVAIVAPLRVGAIAVPAAPVARGTAVAASAAFTDPAGPGTYTATWAWGDGTTSAGTVTSTTGDGTVAGSRTYAAPGVYTVALTVRDGTGQVATGTAEGYVVVYDPAGGFVTGGGWITAPASACQRTDLCGGAAGKANFGLNAKYPPNGSAPTGNTEYSVGAFRLKSTGYTWLVVGGATARYQGTATINGAGSYAFQLTIIDGKVAGGGGTDRFRLRVWEAATGTVVYDTQPGAADGAAPTTPTGGGSIVIH